MLCVIAKLAPDATQELRLLRDAALPEGQAVKPLYGHITIAAYLPEDDETFARDCLEMIRGTSPFTVRYEKIEVLRETSIIVAVPSKPAELVSLHEKIAEKYMDSLNSWTRGENWYPHTTLLCDPAADLDALCRSMRKAFVPFEAEIEWIELSRVEEDGYTIVETVDLR